MRKLRLLSLLSFAIIFVGSSCTKEGPAGPQGATGTQGPPGATGATGTANVIYTAWFNMNTLTWADSTHADLGTISRGNRAAPGVTAAVVDNGVVLSYYRSTNSGVVPLPYTFGTTANLRQYGFLLKTGTITYYVANLTTGTATGVTPTGELRYVIIPGGTAGGRSAEENRYGGYTVTELKAMSYEQVARLFHIPESGSNQ